MSAASRRYTILHTEASRGWGGQERRIVVEAMEMQSRGHRVVIGTDPRGRLWGEAIRAGLPVLAVFFSKWRLPAASRRVRRFCQEQGVEIINTHSSLDSWAGLLATRGWRGGPVLVRTRHLSTPIKGSWPTRWLYRAPAAVITTGQVISELIAHAAGVPRERLATIPTGVDLEEFTPRPRRALTGVGEPGWPEDAWIIGTVAVLRSWKGHLYLVEAIHQLAARGEPAYLLIVGDGPYRQVIQDRVTELGLEEKVWFAGYQEEVPTWVAAMDIVALASYAHEGVPQALLQALAMAKPVVATRCGGIPEVVIPGITGLLAHPRNAGELAEALLIFRYQPGLREACGRAGRELVAGRYSRQAMGQAVEAVYDRVAGGAGA